MGTTTGSYSVTQWFSKLNISRNVKYFAKNYHTIFVIYVKYSTNIINTFVLDTAKQYAIILCFIFKYRPNKKYPWQSLTLTCNCLILESLADYYLLLNDELAKTNLRQFERASPRHHGRTHPRRDLQRRATKTWRTT